MSVQLHFPQGAISRKPQAPTLGVGADLSPFPGYQRLGPLPREESEGKQKQRLT